MSDDESRPQGDLVRIFKANTQVEAQSLVLFLESRGIRAVVETDTFQAPVSFVALESALRSDVYVNEEDRPKAEALLVEFEQVTRRADEIEPDPKDDLEVRKSWADWPCCPQCSARRTVECPDCGESGDDFPLSEYQDEEEPLEPTPPKQKRGASEEDGDEGEADEEAAESTLAGPRPFVACPACAHSFRPVFLRLCPQCDHHFDDGRYATPAEKKRPQSLVSFLIGVVLFVVAFAVLYLTFGPKPGRGPEGAPPPREVMPRVENSGDPLERSHFG